MPPITVMIKPVSGACNMRCQYCFYYDEMKRRETAVYPVMSKETMEKVVRRTIAYADKYASFVFQGGEPSLAGVEYFECFVNLQKQYNTRHIRITNAIQTNGLDLPDAMIQFLSRNHFLVGISVDGNEYTHDLHRKDVKGTGTYQRVQNTVQRLEKAGVQYNVLCVVNRFIAENCKSVLNSLAVYPYLQFIPCMDGLDGVEQSYSLSNKAYADFLKASFLLYEKRWADEKPISIRQFDNWVGMLLGNPPENCAMNGQCTLNFLIESNGDVYPCDFYALDEWCLGNINNLSLRQLRRTPRAALFCDQSIAVPDRCVHCRWYMLCRNGCRRERNPDTGVFRFCEGTKQFLDEFGERLLRIARSLSKSR